MMAYLIGLFAAIGLAFIAFDSFRDKSDDDSDNIGGFV
jgi:hypothetical protein